MPLLALKGKDDTPENPKPVAAAASLNASQARPKPTATPRKVISLSRLEPFSLGPMNLRILQSTEPRYAQQKEALLEEAARAVELQISRPNLFPHDATQLMAPFANVRSLSIENLSLGDLPLLPCPEKLESLELSCNAFQTIQSITHYTNLHTLQISGMLLSVTDQGPSKTDRLAVLTQLHNLRTLDCGTLFILDHSAPDERALLIRILGSNPEIEDFACALNVAEDVVQALANLPLRRLSFTNGEIDDRKFALFPFNTLEELRLRGFHALWAFHPLTDLTPLQGSRLRVLYMRCQKNLGDTQVICSMQNLEELYLNDCRLTDEQAEPLLPLAQRLRRLQLSGNPKLSDEMRQSLKAAFGDKVSLETLP